VLNVKILTFGGIFDSFSHFFLKYTFSIDHVKLIVENQRLIDN